MTEGLTAGVRFKFFRRDGTIVLDLVDNHAWVPTSESRRTQELANEVQELKVEQGKANAIALGAKKHFTGPSTTARWQSLGEEKNEG